MSRRGKRSGGGDTALAVIILGIIAMPLVGIYFLCRDNENDRIVGGILLVLGIILWIAGGIH